MTLPPPGSVPGEAVASRLVGAALGAVDILTVYLGEHLGWYHALLEHGPATSTQLAEATGTDERYAREWLEQQAATGLLEVDDAAAAPTARRFTMPPGAAEVLTDTSSLLYLAPLARLLAAAAAQLPALARAYRDGAGVSWAQMGPDARTGQADMNRPWFDRALPDALAGVPEVHAVLARPGARIGDVGCGEGWSSLALARAYPEARVDGYDPDQPSVDAARRHVDDAGLTRQVTIHCADAAVAIPSDTYDAVFAFECLHDLPHPVEVLSAVRRSLAPRGIAVVMDEAADDTFGAPADEVQRLLYGFSTLICLPDSMSHRPTAATGTVIRPATVRNYAIDAGFSAVDVLPITDFGFWRFYALTG